MINPDALRSLLERKGFILLPSHGVSMAPIIRTGSVCRFEPLVLEELKQGDIILYVAATGELVGHRFLRTVPQQGRTFYLCKGDYNRAPDALVPPENILGRMVSIQYKNAWVPTDSLWMKAWGKLMVHGPALSLGIQIGARLYRKLTGKGSTRIRGEGRNRHAAGDQGTRTKE